MSAALATHLVRPLRPNPEPAAYPTVRWRTPSISDASAPFAAADRVALARLAEGAARSHLGPPRPPRPCRPQSPLRTAAPPRRPRRSL